MKTFYPFVVILGLIMTAPAAMAQCLSGCDYVTPTPTSPPRSFSVGGNAKFNDFGATMFEGQEGYAKVERLGESGVNITLDAAGDLCDLDCANGGFNFSSYAGSHVMSTAGALESRSGHVATTVGQGGASASTILYINKP